MSVQTQGSALGLMEGFLNEIRSGQQKQAGSGDGSDPTSLPGKDVDNGTRPATQGARAKENEADVRKQLGNAGNAGQRDANSTPNNTEKSQSGGMKRLTADDPAPQTIKGAPPKPEDKGPGDSTFGDRKYASLAQRSEALEVKLAAAKPKKAAVSENAVPAKNVETDTVTEPPKGDSEQKRAAAEKYQEDAQAGYVAAMGVAQQLGFSAPVSAEDEATLTKFAEEKIAGIQTAARQDAQMFVEYLQGHAAGMAKRADPDPDPGPGPVAPPPDPTAGAEAGAMPPEAGGGEGGEMPEEELRRIADALEAAGVTPEDLAAAIAQVEQQEGGGGGPPEAGAEAPPAGPPAGPPMA